MIGCQPSQLVIFRTSGPNPALATSTFIMHPLLPSLAAINDIGLIFGLAGMGIGLVSGLLGMYFGHRRRVLWHETARIAPEKGQPIPPLSPDEAAGNRLHELATQVVERELIATRS